jgi:16S rRNA (guanine527-N7)-methyltransferase
VSEEISVPGLGGRHGLGGDAVRRLQRLLDVVVADQTAPTTVTTPAAVLRDHLADSLVALDLEFVRNALAVADLGAGAGFPGLPLAIALPGGHVSLVESNGRKCEFIQRTADACGIANVDVVHARAEEWVAGRGRCDLVVVRAVAPLPVVAEYAAPLLHVGGTLLAWKGRRDPDDELQGARAAALLGLEPASPISVEPYPGALHRHLHPLVKVRETPPEFPRRPGMARKRPLG